MKHRILMLGAIILLAGAGRAFAHHAFTAEYDGTQKAEVEGVVTEFAWRNPHSFMKIDVMGKDGTTQSWTLEWGSASLLANSQITRTTLKPGDHIVVNGQIARDPSAHRMLVTSVKRPSDGWEWKGQAR
jgi:thiamine monophosphate kinase